MDNWFIEERDGRPYLVEETSMGPKATRIDGPMECRLMLNLFAPLDEVDRLWAEYQAVVEAAR